MVGDRAKNKGGHHSPRRIALQPLKTAASRLLTDSQPSHHNSSLGSLSQDTSFLGSIPGLTVPIHVDDLTDAEQVVVLKNQLAVTVKALETVKAEVQELRDIVAVVQDQYPTDSFPHFENVKFVRSRRGSAAPSTADTAYTAVDSVSASPAGSMAPMEDVQGGSIFPRLDLNHRTASPLPSPHDHAAASSFLAGALNCPPVNKTTKNAGPALLACVKRNSIASGLERRQSEPCLHVPAALRDQVAPASESRYDHLTFFVSNHSCCWSSSNLNLAWHFEYPSTTRAE